MPSFDPAPLAARLHAAWQSRQPIAPFGAAGEVRSVVEAYAVQQAWARLREAEGDRTVGRKIGLTSPGMQRQMGVAEPDFGRLWESRRFPSVDGVATVSVAPFLQPRIEGEVAFLLREPLAGPGVTEADVRAAADAAALAVEIVDSRIADWKIDLVDTVADNASYGGFACGQWSEQLLDCDLPQASFSLARNGVKLVEERGSAVLGSPLAAVGWLANTLGALGSGIRAGDIVLSGSFGPAAPAVAGDSFVFSGAGEEPLTVHLMP